MAKNNENSRGLAGWIEDFICGLNNDGTVKKASKESESTEDKIASINIMDLSKVVWNDETFYVLFDEETGKATVLNEFTNIVTTINATTIEEVDDALNGLKVVKSKEEPDTLEKYSSESSESEESIEFDPYDLISELQGQIDKLTKELEEIKSSSEVDCEDAEVAHFEEMAKETQEQIDKDNSVDITTPEGRVNLRNDILDDLDAIDKEVKEVDTLEESSEESLETEELEEVEEVEQIKEEISEIEEPKEEIVEIEESKEEDRQAEPISLESPAMVEEQMYMEGEIDEDSKLDDFRVITDEEAEDFKEAKCPNCGGELLKCNSRLEFQGIVCSGKCKKEFAVNMNSGKIFEKR